MVGLKSLDVSSCNELMIIENSLAREYFFTHKSTFGAQFIIEQGHRVNLVSGSLD